MGLGETGSAGGASMICRGSSNYNIQQFGASSTIQIDTFSSTLRHIKRTLQLNPVLK